MWSGHLLSLTIEHALAFFRRLSKHYRSSYIPHNQHASFPEKVYISFVHHQQIFLDELFLSCLVACKHGNKTIVLKEKLSIFLVNMGK